MGMLKALQGGPAAVAPAGVPESYEFSSDFERALVFLACSNRDVFSRIGARLNPKAISDAQGALLIKAAQEIASETGEGPSSLKTVIQRLSAWRTDGKLTQEAINTAMAYLDEAEDAGLPDIEETVNEAARVLKKIALKAAQREAIQVKSADDLAKMGAKFADVERIGAARLTVGESLGLGIIDDIVAANKEQKFPTGCPELDSILHGGLPYGYTLFIGREKSGKSMVLTSVAAEAVFRGQNVAIATLELATRKQMERVIANLTNCSLDEVKSGASIVRYRMKLLEPQLGKLTINFFTADTPVTEILAWVDRTQEQWGQKIDLLAVDYVDLVGSGKVGKDEGDYKAQKTVGNAFRAHALQNQYVMISASQARRGAGGAGKRIDNDDVADSMHKIRIPDLVLAMQMEPDDKNNIDWFISAGRDGQDRVGTGQLPAHRDMARMYPPNRMEPWR